MKIIFLLQILIIISYNCISQDLKIIYETNFQKDSISKKFDFLHKEIDTNQIFKVAIYSAIGKKKEARIDFLFNVIYQQAIRKGANAFQIRSFQRNDSLDENKLTLVAFYVSDSIANINKKKIEKNSVYIFGEQKAPKNYSHYIYVNKKEVKIPSGKYFKFLKSDDHSDEKIKVNYGGIMGGTLVLNFPVNKNKEPLFFALFDGGIKPVGLFDGAPLGLSFSNGGFVQLSTNFGLLLKELFIEIPPTPSNQ